MINEDIPGDLDVICLQEVFNEDAWTILNEKLRSKYPYILFDAHRVRVSSLKFTMVNSGLYIASKYPFVQSKFYPYKNSYSEDALSGKGKSRFFHDFSHLIFQVFYARKSRSPRNRALSSPQLICKLRPRLTSNRAQLASNSTKKWKTVCQSSATLPSLTSKLRFFVAISTLIRALRSTMLV